MNVRRNSRPVRDLCEWLLYPPSLLLMMFLTALPTRLALWMGRRMGDLGFYIIRFRRSVVLGNLRHVFGDSLDERELLSLARRSYQQTLMTQVELFRSCLARPETFDYPIEFENLDQFRALQEQGRPLILCLAHSGNFYLTGFAAGQRGFRFTTLVKRLNAAQYEQLLERARRRLRCATSASAAPLARRSTESRRRAAPCR